jgi:UDP-N-acetylglucosamine 3-dehydrogenase
VGDTIVQTMTLPRKRILLIGLGRWGANHLRLLQSMPVELFVSDVDARRINSVELSDDHWSTNPRTLFSQIDAAVVVTPAPAHSETCRELLEMGKDVFVEKPMSLVSAEAKKLTKLAERAGLILQVGHIFRFDPASLWLRDAIAKGVFGRIKIMRSSAASNVLVWIQALPLPTASISSTCSIFFSVGCRGESMR